MLTVFYMVIIYSTIAPLMAVIGTLFFVFKYFVDKYNLIYLTPVAFESNGMAVNTLTKYTIFGIMLFNVQRE